MVDHQKKRRNIDDLDSVKDFMECIKKIRISYFSSGSLGRVVRTP